jgi:hypothetical protein
MCVKVIMKMRHGDGGPWALSGQTDDIVILIAMKDLRRPGYKPGSSLRRTPKVVATPNQFSPGLPN